MEMPSTMTRLRPGFKFEELLKAPVTVTGTNPPAPCDKFEEFGLDLALLENIRKQKYTEPTPIQRHIISILMAGQDVMASGQTGTGKTASYLLPIINKLLMAPPPTLGYKTSGLPCQPEALILSPVRELAKQIAAEGNLYVDGTAVKCMAVYGGTSLGEEIRQLRTGYNIIVATPGRLQQLLEERKLALDHVKYFIIDEVDKMLALGFIKDVKEIMKYLPKKIVTAMFSATYPYMIQKLSKSYLKSDLFVVVGSIGGASFDVMQSFEPTESSEKYSRLLNILNNMSDIDKILIFCETREQAEELAIKLVDNEMQAALLHGLKTQGEREAALAEFIDGEITILVATAVAARGLDIPKVTNVINYDLPSDIDEYVQQIGRTGRVGNVGKAISFFEFNKDDPMASKLIEVLKAAGQVVPPFLENVARTANLFDSEEDALYYSNVRNFNSLGTRPPGIPLPCEIKNETWD